MKVREVYTLEQAKRLHQALIDIMGDYEDIDPHFVSDAILEADTLLHLMNNKEI